MQVEIALPNKEGTLLPGAYVQVELPLAGSKTLVVPTNVLLFRPDGPRIAVVDDKDVVHLHRVKLGTDFGSSVAVLNGLTSGDVIVVNPPDSINEGDVVSIPGGTGWTPAMVSDSPGGSCRGPGFGSAVSPAWCGGRRRCFSAR